MGLALGAYAGWRRGGPWTTSATALSLILYSMPYFVLGMILLVDLRRRSRLVPDPGCSRPARSTRRRWTAPRLSALTSSCRWPRSRLGLIGQYSILMRSSVIETLGRGLRHDGPGQGHRGQTRPAHSTPCPTRCCRRSRSSPSTSATSSPAPSPSEVVFNWPGLGTLTVDALTARDYPVLQGIFLFLSRHRSCWPTSRPTSCTASSTRG